MKGHKFIFLFFSLQAEEEARSLQKKIQTIENELDQTQEQLMQVNAKLEEKDKALQNVSTSLSLVYFRFGECNSVYNISVQYFKHSTTHLLVMDRLSLEKCQYKTFGSEIKRLPVNGFRSVLLQRLLHRV